ncbi:hypothetical protein [Pseudarthrobacter sp. MDT3-1]
MATLDPEYMRCTYSCEYRGIPGTDHGPDDYPMFWKVRMTGRVWDDEGGDGEDAEVGYADVYLVPDAGLIDLFFTLDAVNQEVANVAEMLTIKRPDLIEDMEIGGDLMYLSSLWIDPKFRGNDLGHAALKAIIGTIGRSAALVVLLAAPVLTDNGPEEGTQEHEAAKAALRRYWMDFGFEEADGDYVAFRDMAQILG